MLNKGCVFFFFQILKNLKKTDVTECGTLMGFESTWYLIIYYVYIFFINLKCFSEDIKYL